MTRNQLIRLMYSDGAIAERYREGNRDVWRVKNDGDNVACGPAVRKLIDEKLVWTHFPMNGGSAGLNEAGEAEAARLGFSPEIQL